MTKEEIQKNSEHWYNKYKELEKENRLLGERCNQLLKDKGDLTDQIADIKANCDLAIEGRDVKIKELELKLTVEKDQHQEEINLHLHAEDYIKSLEQQIEKMKKEDELKKVASVWNYLRTVGAETRIEELEQQIEKMKCCENCKFKHCDKSNSYQTCWYCTNKDKWKLGR